MGQGAQKWHHRGRGFTLIEISIVLVVIGLIVGGILVGRDLIKAAELRKVVTQKEQIQTAVMTFRLKYNALPGDMPNATNFWGTAANCFAVTTGTLTCNGNGNGALSYLANDTFMHEPWHFWRHLGNAELIPGSYTGFSNNTKCSQNNYCLEGGINGLAGPFRGSGWFAFSLATRSGSKVWQGRATNQNRNVIALANPSNISGNPWYGASFSARDAWNIDNKIDDGKPYTGKMVDMSGTDSTFTSNCATMNSDEFGNNPPGTTTNAAQYHKNRTTISTTEGCLPFFDLF